MQLSAALVRIRAVACPLGLAVLMAACSSSGSPAGAPASSAAAAPTSKYPNAIAVLGHSGATGFASDPKRPFEDARTNSWATGDNPEVNSIYLRLLALNPAVRDHNVNLAADGTDVNELAGACQYDDGALYHMPITADDLAASDGAHLSVAGHRKQAELEWRVLGFA